MSEQNQNLFNQVDEQIANGQPATVLVERSNGDITPGQIRTVGMTEGKTEVLFGDTTRNDWQKMPYKPVSNEKLTDQYQQQLAERLAGMALRGSVEVGVKPSAESPMDKYTKDFVEGDPYAYLLDPELTGEQRAKVAERIKGMDLRTDDQKRADAERLAGEAMSRQRVAANHRYNVARQSGAGDEAASASADRAYSRTYNELLAEELKKAGLQ
ncbi:MAG TPA: hypothetical protein VF261_02305 [Candidatus Saccharimonadales bacterium]